MGRGIEKRGIAKQRRSDSLGGRGWPRLKCGAMQPETNARIQDLRQTLSNIEKVMDLDDMDARARELEEKAAEPSLWDDPDHAQQVTTELSNVQAKLRKVRELRQRLEDLPVMYELAEEEGDTSLADAERGELAEAISALEAVSYTHLTLPTKRIV